MTYTEIASLIESIGLPFTYYTYPIDEAPDLPYIVFYYPSRDDFDADDINYVPIVDLNIELYSRNKDFTTEALVESALTTSGIRFDKTESYLNTEHMYEVLYEMQILITE